MSAVNLYQARGGNLAPSISLKGKDGRRPVNGGEKVFQEDPHRRDYIPFYGDNGAGLGARYKASWTGVIARVMHVFVTTTADQVLELLGKLAAVVASKDAS
jgi:hypothetical protein